MLTSAFKMHVTANSHAENEAQSNLLGTDFYRTMKVDNHIHLAGAPTAKQFVNFVRDKLENEGDTVVFEDGQTLSEVFKDAGLDSDHLTIDAFSVLADYSVYQRFDNFNSKYSPFRMAQMRKIFLKVSKSTRRNSQVVHFSCSSSGCLDHFGVLSHKHLIPRIIPLPPRWRITSKEDFSLSSPRLSWPGLNNQRDTIQLLRCGCRFMGWNEKNGSTWPSGCSCVDGKNAPLPTSSNATSTHFAGHLKRTHPIPGPLFLNPRCCRPGSIARQALGRSLPWVRHTRESKCPSN